MFLVSVDFILLYKAIISDQCVAFYGVADHFGTHFSYSTMAFDV